MPLLSLSLAHCQKVLSHVDDGDDSDDGDDDEFVGFVHRAILKQGPAYGRTICSNLEDMVMMTIMAYL